MADLDRLAIQVLVDYDTGERLVSTAKTFGALRDDLRERRRPAEWNTLWDAQQLPR